MPVTVQVIFPLQFRLGQYLHFGGLHAFLMSTIGRCLNLWSVWVNVLTSTIEELLVIRLLAISSGLKKSVICTCDFVCVMVEVEKIRFLAGVLGSPVLIVLFGFLEVHVEALTIMSHTVGVLVYSKPS